MDKLTKQEIFDRAVRGLRSQGFKRAWQASESHPSEGYCKYLTSDGLRCAWGWVDQSLGTEDHGDIWTLRWRGIGLAASLDGDLALFARRLQAVHDLAKDHLEMETELRSFAKAQNLTWPED